MGEYTLLMMKSITLPDRWSMFFKQLIKEIYKLGVDSLWIVIIISVFIGTVIAIQISLNISSPLIPKFTIGYTTREIILLEFSSSIMALILAGKVGSNIASEIGTMRVTEQIDAMEIMGVNSANFLILPKMLGLMIFIPVLVIFSMFTGIMGGIFASYSTSTGMTPSSFEYGLQFYFNEFYIWYSIIKKEVVEKRTAKKIVDDQYRQAMKEVTEYNSADDLRVKQEKCQIIDLQNEISDCKEKENLIEETIQTICVGHQFPERYCNLNALTMFAAYLNNQQCNTVYECMLKYDEYKEMEAIKRDISSLRYEIRDFEDAFEKAQSELWRCMHEQEEAIEGLCQEQRSHLDEIAYNQETTSQALTLLSLFDE